ncbi:MAG TPA: bifunctional molybdenum cofactor biosynthesis protein MoaC/MoaB, partial [Chitinophagaceae bacterium]|nr:bifunctional molybdenum cofactor biosynthesis protein MoaC/MoaB [Chitinophagaceae bacterium]
EAVRAGTVPKGNVFEFSRAAGLLAIKKTSDVIPDCHPLPVEFAAIRHSLEGLTIRIEVEVHTIYRTGVEVEAMHGAAITALTMYDMLKPIDKAVEIGTIRLQHKEGGKSDRRAAEGRALTCAVVVCSDTVSKGAGTDASGALLVERMEAFGLQTVAYEVIPDEVETIRTKAQELSSGGIDLLLFTGGTGLSPRDVTPEAIAPLIQTPIPGIMEAVRHYGQERMPFALLSRGVAGFIGDALVLTLPGSPRAVQEAVDALFPALLHVFTVRSGLRH